MGGWIEKKQYVGEKRWREVKCVRTRGSGAVVLRRGLERQAESPSTGGCRYDGGFDPRLSAESPGFEVELACQAYYERAFKLEALGVPLSTYAGGAVERESAWSKKG